MWIFLEGGRFLSIAADPADAQKLRVYARLPGDLEVDFPDAEILEVPADSTLPGQYRFQTILPREQVMQAIAHELEDLSYPIFRKTICNANRVLAAARCDDVMRQAQESAREGMDQDSACERPAEERPAEEIPYK
uniref:Uncharacterized protein n=1 Tax=Magnetococcus massalia (strain MO-1) TaxID=451514 RepID=A0A1S7LFX3_MAGMO|nr:conserved protein of unknown function [Candidatus Magnetococcus massalia]